MAVIFMFSAGLLSDADFGAGASAGDGRSQDPSAIH